MSLAFVGIGSNLDDPLSQVTRAVESLACLPDTTLLGHSSWYQNAAIGPGEQPDFINGVALLETQLSPLALLDHLQDIEHIHKRVRTIHWGPRTLDLDLLLYDQQIIHSERLEVPHPRLQQRNFVVYPLAQLCPELVLPCGTSIESLLGQLPATGLHQLSSTSGAERD